MHISVCNEMAGDLLTFNTLLHLAAPCRTRESRMAKQKVCERAIGSDKAELLQQQIESLSSRDLQLWSIGTLLMLLLVSALCAAFAPELAGRLAAIHIDGGYLPQLLSGLVALVVLFNIYVIAQKRTLNSTRQVLVQELIRNEHLENLSLIDPLTQLLNRRATEEMIAREISRANRLGTELAFLLIDVVKSVRSSTHGSREVSDDLLVQAAQLIRSTFRGSDIVFRYSGDEFLVVMSETSEQQAECAVQRLLRQLDNWNVTNNKDYEMSVTWVLNAYVPGESVRDTLDRVSRKMQSVQQGRSAPVYLA